MGLGERGICKHVMGSFVLKVKGFEVFIILCVWGQEVLWLSRGWH